MKTFQGHRKLYSGAFQGLLSALTISVVVIVTGRHAKYYSHYPNDILPGQYGADQFVFVVSFRGKSGELKQAW